MFLLLVHGTCLHLNGRKKKQKYSDKQKGIAIEHNLKYESYVKHDQFKHEL